VSDLPISVWREIEEASVRGSIRLGVLRTILKKSRRSNDQNSLLWALYTEALEKGGEDLGGWTTAELHEYCLGEYHGWQIAEALGMKRKRPVKRSSRLTKTEFRDFIDFVVQRFAEHGIVLSLPSEDAAQ
jgi:hypothetical protein